MCSFSLLTKSFAFSPAEVQGSGTQCALNESSSGSDLWSVRELKEDCISFERRLFLILRDLVLSAVACSTLPW